MKVKDLIDELKNRNPEAKVYLLGEDGKESVHKLYRIESNKLEHLQDVLIMPRIQ